MKCYRKWAIFLLIAYGVLLLGTNYHEHPQGADPIGLHCKLCQVSQTSLEHAGFAYFLPVNTRSEMAKTGLFLFSPGDIQSCLFGRAPPLS